MPDGYFPRAELSRLAAVVVEAMRADLDAGSFSLPARDLAARIHRNKGSVSEALRELREQRIVVVTDIRSTGACTYAWGPEAARVAREADHVPAQAVAQPAATGGRDDGLTKTDVLIYRAIAALVAKGVKPSRTDIALAANIANGGHLERAIKHLRAGGFVVTEGRCRSYRLLLTGIVPAPWVDPPPAPPKRAIKLSAAPLPNRHYHPGVDREKTVQCARGACSDTNHVCVRRAAACTAHQRKGQSICPAKREAMAILAGGGSVI